MILTRENRFLIPPTHINILFRNLYTAHSFLFFKKIFFSFTTHTHRGMGQRRLQTEKPQSLRISVEKIRRKKEIKENIFVCVIKIWFLFLFLFILCVCLFGLCGWGYTSSISESTQENKDAWTSQKVLDNFFPGYTFYFLFFKGCCCCCRYDDTFLCCCASRFTNISSAVGLSTTNFPNDFRRFGT